MPDDIVDRLRRQGSVLAREAADEIEHLRKRHASRSGHVMTGHDSDDEIARVLVDLKTRKRR